MTIRTEVVALLTGIDMSHGGPDTWTLDGRPITPEELRTVGEATRAEVEAARAYAVRAQEYHEERLTDLQRIEEITKPYLAGLPETTAMGDVVATMTEQDRAEFLSIMDRLAPDGMLVISATDEQAEGER